MLNGGKTFTTNAHYAQVCVAMAVTDRTAAQHGISAFIIEPARPDSASERRKTSLACARVQRARSCSATAACPIHNCWASLVRASSTAFEYSTAAESPSPPFRWAPRREPSTPP